ncbi:NADP-dependent oxidoreductase domain-containing protein [Panaeolus papilionaceus]|nr:NADP-dependent oxidoreductase domain-containing protein [Panaeolus papilionaceus]
MEKKSSFELLDVYCRKGGNFINTANNYQDGSSERFIGEWAEQKRIRHRLFIASKYSCNWKIRSDHLAAHQTPIEEMMNAVHHLVAQGKVLYLGVSDSPAWAVAQANQYPLDHNLTPFVVYQGRWNVMQRDFEQEVIPIARANGLALAPWAVLAGGKICLDADEEHRLKSGGQGRTAFSDAWLRNDQERMVCAALEKVAREFGAKHITSVAIAYFIKRPMYSRLSGPQGGTAFIPISNHRNSPFWTIR